MNNKKTFSAFLLALLVATGSIFSTDVILSVCDDATALGADPDGNYGSLNFMRIRHQAANDWGNYFPLARFDLSALPDNIVVNYARIAFWNTLADDSGANWPTDDDFPLLAIYKNLQDWNETTATYNNRPSVDSIAIETLDHIEPDVKFTVPETIASNVAGWLFFDGSAIAALVQDWANGQIPNYGVTIKGTGDYTDSSRYFDMLTKEHTTPAVRPYLYVNYELCGYAGWSNDWIVDIGSEINDFDGDGLNNLGEYGLGGDPTNAMDQGISPEICVVNIGGSNLIKYIHPQLSDLNSGLTYFLELSTNLSGGIWTNSGYTILGTNVTADTFNFVTNITNTLSKQKFIRLIIESQQKSFNVKNYGAKGNGIADDTTAILATIFAANSSKFSTEVFFPPGNYRISSSNDYALRLENLSDICLRGEGTNSVLLVSNPGNGGLGFFNCTNIAVQGITIDYDPLPFTQGTITAVDIVGGTYELQIDPGYLELSHPAFSIAESRWGITVDLPRKAYGLWAYFSSNWTNLGNRIWKMTSDNPDFLQAHPLSVGDRFAHMARRWTAFDIECNSCIGAELKNITVYAAAGLTIGAFYSSGIVVQGLHVGIKPGSTRLLSTNGDCVHSASCSDGLLIENCFFEGMPDDGINIHGRGGVIISNITDHIKRVGTPRQAQFFAGDEIQILNNLVGGIRGNAIILNAKKINNVVWEITLDKALPGLNASWYTGDKLSPISRCGQGSIIRNNFIGAHRGREVLLLSHDIIVSNNHFFNPSLAWESVSLHNDYTYHAEGPASYNIGIYDNTFRGGDNKWSWSGAAVGISSFLSGGIQTPSYDSSNIVVEANSFINIDGPAVQATSVSGVEIKDNTVNTALGIKVTATPVVLLENAKNIKINNLDIHDLNPTTYAAVHIKNSVSSAPDAVIITNLTTDLASGSVDIQDDR